MRSRVINKWTSCVIIERRLRLSREITALLGPPAMNRLLLAMLALLSASGCGLRPGREASPQSIWMSSRYSSAEEAWVYLNFYSEYEDFDRYVGYAIVNYMRNTDRDANLTESEILEDSLRLCREEFRDAYSKKTLTRWDGKLKTPVPYSPEYIAVVVRDFSGNADQIGIVVPAAEVFSTGPIAKIAESAPVSRRNIWYDDISEEEKRRGYSPGKVGRYTHVEDHMRSIERGTK